MSEIERLNEEVAALQRALTGYEQALQACANYIASDCEGDDFEPSALTLARAALSGCATDENEPGQVTDGGRGYPASSSGDEA